MRGYREKGHGGEAVLGEGCLSGWGGAWTGRGRLEEEERLQGGVAEAGVGGGEEVAGPGLP